MLLTWKVLLPTLLALVLTTVIVPTEKVSPTFTIIQTNSTTTIYLDPPTINGTVIDQEFNVSVMVRDAQEVHNWGVGMIFNATLLNCTGFFEGEFLKNVGPTYWTPGSIDNTAGVIEQYGSALLGNLTASGDGRLAYATFKVKAPGVSDMHLRDVEAWKLEAYVPVPVPTNIIDTYTVVDTTSHTVVTVSNSTGKTGFYPHSGFYNHAFNLTLKEISFNVTGPHNGFANVTIPDTLLWGEFLVIVDSVNVTKTLTYNGTHFSLYFTYSNGIHEIRITTRALVPSTISMDLSSTNITLGENVTISGKITPADNTTRAGVPVTISCKPSGGTWTTFATVTTTSYSNYSYTWAQNKTGTYEVKAKWEGDKLPGTLGAESDVKNLTVLGAPVRRQTFEATKKGEVFEVVTESNFTASGFAFNESMNEIYFKVDGMVGNTYICNITIPKGLLWCDDVKDWIVWVDNVKIGVETSKNETHTFIYFTHIASVHNIRIATKISTISIAFSKDSITLGSRVTINGTIIPLRTNVTVKIQSRLTDGNWTTLANVTTNENGNYSYTWKPEKTGTYEVKTSWEGDQNTHPAQSEVKTLTVKKAAGIPLMIVIVAVVVIIVIAAVAVYFVKFRKPK